MFCEASAKAATAARAMSRLADTSAMSQSRSARSALALAQARDGLAPMELLNVEGGCCTSITHSGVFPTTCAAGRG